MGIVDGKTELKMRTCQNKGFHITFENGWIISIQIGAGNYCDNYDLIFENGVGTDLYEKKPDLESNTAEVWCWNIHTGEHYPEDPLSRQTPEDILKIMNRLSKRKKPEVKQDA